VDDNYKHPVSEKKVKFRSHILTSKKENIPWIVTITVLSFALSASLSFLSSEVLEESKTFIALGIVLIIIIIGIIFDIIGIAVTAADETPFHAMASRKLYGAKQSIKLIRNANKVSSVCNDVVGDICGVISGTASALIVVRISINMTPLHASLLSLLFSGLVASLTVGGKALGKTIAIEKSNSIVYKAAVVIKFFADKFNLKKVFGSGKNNGKKNGNTKEG
jgi:hypothetical protein